MKTWRARRTRGQQRRLQRLVIAGLALAAFALVASPPASACCFKLAPRGQLLRPAYHVGHTPSGLAAGDFNADGRLDLVATGIHAPKAAFRNVAVLLATEDGFARRVLYPAGRLPFPPVTADLDRDGDLDIVVVNRAAGRYSGVSILLGTGDGRFGPARRYRAGVKPTAVAVGQFNRDRNPDLAVANAGLERNENGNYPYPGSVSIFGGRGDGTFAPARERRIRYGPRHIVATQLNGDRFDDIVIARQQEFEFETNGVSVLLGESNGRFGRERRYKVEGEGPEFVTTGDFNEDGEVDLAVSNTEQADTVSIFRGRGDGTFVKPLFVPVGPSAGYRSTTPRDIAVADYNGDGHSDLAVSTSGRSEISIVLGHGDGSFAADQTHYDPRAFEYSPLITGDFNRDGRPDLAIGRIGAGDVLLMVNQGPVDG